MRRCTRNGGLAVAAVLLLVGCDASAPADTPADVESVLPGAPPGVDLPTDVVVVADEDPRRLLVVTLGSSSCPTVPVTADWDAEEDVLRMEVDVDTAPDEPCTADATPTTSVLRLPPDAPDAPGLTVVVDDRALTVGGG